MNNNLVEQAVRATESQRHEELSSSAAPDEFSQAIGKNALLQAQVDVKIASNMIGISDELRFTQNEVETLRARLDQLDRNLAPRIRTTRNASPTTIRRK